jgi:transcriptional regulator with XRE-family HTH domain
LAHRKACAVVYLQLRRRKVGLTQKRLAEMAGVGADLISEIETGRTNPRGDELARIAKALGVHPPERLVTLVADPYEHELPEPRS